MLARFDDQHDLEGPSRPDSKRGLSMPKLLTSKESIRAMRNRRELIAAGITRRELSKMGLLTSAGYLVVKGGLSARADNQCASPATRSFIEAMPRFTVKQPVASLS